MYFFAISETVLAKSLNCCQSDFDSHIGLTAALNGWINGCISVDERSFFSYQVAAGRTTSEYIGVETIRKSISTTRSNLPIAPLSRQIISWGLTRSLGLASNPFSAPNKCFIKYSAPLPEEANKFERHKKNALGWFWLASGSSAAKCKEPFFNSSTTFFEISLISVVL